MHGHKVNCQTKLHFITLTVVGWIDVFSRQEYRNIIIDSLKFCQKNKGLLILSYVIMTNHLHLIVRSDKIPLSDILRDFKKYTSNHITRAILKNKKESRSVWMLKLFKYYAKFNTHNTTYQFWRNDNRPTELFSAKWINQKINYIHLNPVKQEIVDQPVHYKYSSALDYAGGKGLLDVELLDINYGDIHW